jgi:serine protease Do
MQRNRGRSFPFGQVTPFALIAAAGLSAGVLLAPRAVQAMGPQDKAQQLEVANSLSHAFRDAAHTIDPSVVRINVSKKMSGAPAMFQVQPRQRGQGTEPFGEKFFERFFGNDGQMTPAPMPDVEGSGSGLIVKANGTILTNNHVVSGADKITVRLSDGREFPGTVIGADPDSDLACVKINAKDLTPAKFGDSDELQPGDWVVAVGSPFGLEHTVTAGIVSAMGRSEMGLNTYENFIQTDTPINPGNSGGPLVNLEGEVVGINTAIRTASGGSNGVGFAIPSSTVKPVMNALIEHGHVERGWLGVAVQPLTQDLAASVGAQDKHGVLVADVTPDTPAAKAGVKSGDVITQVNGADVATPQALINDIGALTPGGEAKLTILRDGSAKNFDITLAKRPDKMTVASTGSTPDDLGLTLQPLNGDLRQQLSLPDRVKSGVVISEVQPDSIAAHAGLQSGDVITEIAGNPVDSPDQVSKAWSDASGKGLLLKVRRGEQARLVVLRHE